MADITKITLADGTYDIKDTKARNGSINARAFNTVNDIKSATNLVAGSFITTYGYLRKDDGVYNKYIVRAKASGDVTDDYNLLAITADNTIVAERLQDGKEVVVKLKSTDNIQSYLNLTAKKTIILPRNASFTLTDCLFVNNDTEVDLNGATLTFNYSRPTTSFPLVDWDETMAFMGYNANSTFTGYDGYKNITIKNGTIVKGCSDFMHSVNVKFLNVNFQTPANRHALQFSGCNGVTVENCTFNGVLYQSGSENASGCINIDPCNYGAQPYLNSASPIYDHTKNMNFFIISNTFNNGNGSTHIYQTAVDSHGGDTSGNSEYTVCENIIIKGNNFGSPRFSAIIARDWVNANISDNQMINDVAYPASFIQRRGFLTGIKIHDNIATNCYNFWNHANPSLASSEIEICNNKISGLDPNNDAEALFEFMNVKNAKVSGNSIKFQHHVMHCNSGDYFDGTSIGSSTYCANIEFSHNSCEKTLASAIYFGAFRIANTGNMTINGNEFIHDETLQGNYVDILPQSNVTGLKVNHNMTDAPYNFVLGSNVTRFYNYNGIKSPIMTESPAYNATSGSGTFNGNITNFSGLLVQLGHTSNMQSAILRPYLPNGYVDYNKFDNASRKWIIPVCLDNGTMGHVDITIQGASYSWTGSIAIRKIWGLDQ